MIKQVDV